MSILVVQMGHVGRTTGATGAPGEKEFTQRVGDACMALLNGKGGWTVRLIPADTYSSNYKGNAFCAFHADGNNNPSVQGASLGYQTNEGNSLAQSVRTKYVSRGWKGPWHKDNYTSNLSQYYGVANAVAVGNRRAFIFECGTITNPDERSAMTSNEGVNRCALALGDALGIPHGVDNDMSWNDQSLVPMLDANGNLVRYYTYAELAYWDNRYINEIRVIADKLMTGQQTILADIAAGEANDVSQEEFAQMLEQGALKIEFQYPPVGSNPEGEAQLVKSMVDHPDFPDDEESARAIVEGANP